MQTEFLHSDYQSLAKSILIYYKYVHGHSAPFYKNQCYLESRYKFNV